MGTEGGQASRELAAVDAPKLHGGVRQQTIEADEGKARARLRKLPPTEYKFLIYYLDTLSPERAARMAELPGCKEPWEYRKAAMTILAKKRVRDVLHEFADAHAPATTLLIKRLADQATADITDLADCYVTERNEDGVPVGRYLDLQKVRDLGLGHLIKKITPSRGGDVVELVDSQKAIELIGKFRGEFRDKIDLTIGADMESLSEAQLRAIVEGKFTGR